MNFTTPHSQNSHAVYYYYYYYYYYYVSILYRFRDIAGYMTKVSDFDPPYLHLAPS